jgi:hypothetical protein
VPRGYPKAQIRQDGSKCRCVKPDAHRPHTEALGSSAQMRCVSCWYRQSRVTAKSTSRTPRTIQIFADTVYAMTRAIFNNLTQLVQTHPAASGISLKDAVVAMPVPLHPGAERYYREMGVLR